MRRRRSALESDMLHVAGHGCGMAQEQEMRSSECFALLVYNSAAALVVAVAMFALVCSKMVVPSKVEEREVARGFAPLSNRLAFLPPGALLPTEPPTSDVGFATDPQRGRSVLG